jgi:cytochrome c
MLAGKIKNGGSGNWGTISMSPHPNLSQADAASMVKYILNLK